jgi:uncharacterized damage-inducible protein DinB
MTVERIEPGFLLGERDMLEAWLDYHRATLLWKCEGLSDEQLRQRAVAPSSMSLLGIVRHMAEVERWWFRVVLRGEKIDMLYCDHTDRRDADWDEVDTADVTETFATFNEECAAARANVAATASLDDVGEIPPGRDPRGHQVSLRWLVTHMIEEYARHNGHADILREQIDGQTGD